MRAPGPGAGAGALRPGGPLRPSPRPAVASSWQVSSFSETRAQQILQQKPAQYLRFNQHQLSRIYPSPYRVDSSNYNPQPFWNAGCQMGALAARRTGRARRSRRLGWDSLATPRQGPALGWGPRAQRD